MQAKTIDIKKAVWIGVVVIIGVFVYERSKIDNRLKNAAYTQGEVLGIDEGAKGSKYVEYKFIVNGKVYTGSVNISFCKECNYQCCEKGTKVKVRYDSIYPSNSDLLKK